MDIAIIGLGLLGRALSARLVEAGYRVKGFDISQQAHAAAASQRVQVVDSAAAAVAHNKLVLLSLPDAAARRELLWGTYDLARQCTPGTRLLDTTTCSAEETLEDHARLQKCGVELIDVTVVGSSLQVQQGEIVLLAGAREDAPFAAILHHLGKHVFFLGAVGSANRLKLVINLVLGMNRLVLAEGLALAEHAGFDPAEVLHILRQGAAYSRAMDIKGDKMVARDYAPVARLAQHAKDVRLILELAGETGARTPLSNIHLRLLEEAIAKGLGDADNAAIIEVFRRDFKAASPENSFGITSP